MNIDVTLLTNEQILIMAKQMGYSEKIQDKSGGLVDDVYPLIDNPTTLRDFVEGLVNQTLVSLLTKRIIKDTRTDIENAVKSRLDDMDKGLYTSLALNADRRTVLEQVFSDIVDRLPSDS